MKAKIAVGVVVVCGAIGYFGVRGVTGLGLLFPSTAVIEAEGDFPSAPSGGGPAEEGPISATVARIFGRNAAQRVRTVKEEAAVEKLVQQAMQQAAGELLVVDGRWQKLMRGPRTVFEGFQLSRGTISKAGVIALSAYDSALKPIENGDVDSDMKEGRLQVSTAAVWLVDGDRKEQITPPDWHAEFPCISEDGKRVAFVASVLDQRRWPSGQGVYVFDTQTRATTQVRVKARGRMAPLFWEGETLAMYFGLMEGDSSEVAFYKVIP